MKKGNKMGKTGQSHERSKVEDPEEMMNTQMMKKKKPARSKKRGGKS